MVAATCMGISSKEYRRIEFVSAQCQLYEFTDCPLSLSSGTFALSLSLSSEAFSDISGCQLDGDRSGDPVARCYICMRRWLIPGMFLQILHLIHLTEGWVPMSFDGGEWFSGESQVQQGCIEDGFNAFAYDIRFGKLMDFVSIIGFVYATAQSRRLKWRAMNHWDTVCSSWIWLARRWCRRSMVNPLGDESCFSTMQGNVMVARMICLSLYHAAKLNVFLLEQPSSSLMRFHPRFKFLDDATKAVQSILFAKASANGISAKAEITGLIDLPTWMGAFGAPTCKRTVLTSGHGKVLFPLFRTMPKSKRVLLNADSVVQERLVVEGRRVLHKVTGKRGKLTATQVYPREYGASVSRSYRDWIASQPPLDCSDSSDSDYPSRSPEWADAKLLPVVKFLSEQVPTARSVA